MLQWPRDLGRHSGHWIALICSHLHWEDRQAGQAQSLKATQA